MTDDKLAKIDPHTNQTKSMEELWDDALGPTPEVYDRPKEVTEFPLVGHEQSGRVREGDPLVACRVVDGKDYYFDVSSGEPDLPPLYSGTIVEGRETNFRGEVVNPGVTRAFFVDASLKPWLEQIGNGSPLYLVTPHILLGEIMDTSVRSKVRSILLREKLLEGKE